MALFDMKPTTLLVGEQGLDTVATFVPMAGFLSQFQAGD